MRHLGNPLSLDDPSPFSHQDTVLEDIMVGKHFILHARRNLEALVRPHCEFEPHPAVPYPFELVLYMQRAQQSALGLSDDEVDLTESTSIQYALTWNRVITAVSDELADVYRTRAMRPDTVFSRLMEAPYQTYYFAHRVQVRGVALQGYWVSRDLHAGTDEPLLVIQPVAIDPATGYRRRDQLTGFVAIPLRDAWDEAVDAAAWENAKAFDSNQTASIVNRFKQALGEWEPVIALVYDALTGTGGRSYDLAASRAPFNDVALRQVLLTPEEGEVKAVPA